MTFAILTDSTADLDQNWAKEHQVTILGLTIELDGTVYQTVGQAQLTSPELLEAMKNGAKPTTSQVNVGQFQETFKQFAKEGKDLSLCSLFIGLIWDLSECSHGTRPGYRRLPGSRDRDCRSEGCWDWRGLSGHASSSCA